VRRATLIGISLVLLHRPHKEEPKPHLQEVLQLGRERSPHLSMPISIELSWKLYPNRVKQDDVRG
jgi:hypothetical protein